MKSKLFKRLTAIGISLSMMLSMGALNVFATSSAPKIEEVDYEGKGKVEVDFYGKVNYKSPKVTVTDSSGTKYSVGITKKDSDEIDFKVKNYKNGKKYTFKISGIKKKGASGYTSVKGTFKIPKAKTITVESVEYDAEDREVTIEFKNKVSYKNVKVSITKNGKEYARYIVEKDSEEIEIKTKKLKIGSKYSYKISGIKASGASKYTTKSGTFRAYDD